MNTSTELQARIAAESAQAAAATEQVAALTSTRQAALLGDSDAEVARLDRDIEKQKTAAARATERMALLEAKLAEAITAEREAELDALTAKADTGRKSGEKLIADYAKHAGTLGGILRELASIDAAIGMANAQLTKAGRPTVPSPNAIRARPTVYGKRIERKQLGVGDPQHPRHHDYVIDISGMPRDRNTGEYIEKYGEFDVEVSYVEAGHFPLPLQAEVRLPGASPDAPDYWPAPPRAQAESAAPVTTSILAAVRNLLRPAKAA